MKLDTYNAVPKGLLETSVEELDKVISGPTIIYLEGKVDKPLLISTLLHGNETTGFYAMQNILKKYNKGEELPRSLIYFIGNVDAAIKNVRHLPEQRDFNRIWCEGDSAEHRLSAQVIDFLSSYELFASIDIHNNTGKNPLYGCVNKLDPDFISLARLFSPVNVYFTNPSEVFSMALAQYCPSVTIECGQSGIDTNTESVIEYIDSCLNLESLDNHRQINNQNKIYHTIARIKLPPECTIGFGKDDVDKDISFIDDIDNLNFMELKEGTLIGWRHNSAVSIQVIDENGVDSGHEYFKYSDSQILTAKPIIPSMFTKVIEVIHQDCLGYLMEEIS